MSVGRALLAALAELQVLPDDRCGNPLAAVPSTAAHQVLMDSGAMNPSSDIVTLKNTFRAISPSLPPNISVM